VSSVDDSVIQVSLLDTHGLITEGSICRLREIAAQSPQRRARILLHRSQQDPVQAMLICLMRGSTVGMHKHPPGKPEFYVIVEGELAVDIRGEISVDRFVISSAKGMPKVFFTRGNVWHEPSSQSDFAIYFEVYQGPFNKETDVIYYKDVHRIAHQ